MAGIWKYSKETKEGKYLVRRRDGTVPKWPWFVLGARDPVAPVALRAYADEAERLNLDPEYVAGVRRLATEFEDFLEREGPGDPDGRPHRKDDPATIAAMGEGYGA